MIEATYIEFYNIVTGAELAGRTMAEKQNEGWTIVSVFAWNMGQIGVIYNRETPQSNIIGTSRDGITIVSNSSPKRRGRKPKVAS